MARGHSFERRAAATPARITATANITSQCSAVRKFSLGAVGMNPKDAQSQKESEQPRLAYANEFPENFIT